MSPADRHGGTGFLRKRRTSARPDPHALWCCVRLGPVQCWCSHDLMLRAWHAWQIRSTLRCAGVCGEDLECHRARQHSGVWLHFSGAAGRGSRSESKLTLRRRGEHRCQHHRQIARTAEPAWSLVTSLTTLTGRRRRNSHRGPEGEPSPRFWGDIKTRSDEQIPVVTFRCPEMRSTEVVRTAGLTRVAADKRR